MNEKIHLERLLQEKTGELYRMDDDGRWKPVIAMPKGRMKPIIIESGYDIMQILQGVLDNYKPGLIPEWADAFVCSDEPWTWNSFVISEQKKYKNCHPVLRDVNWLNNTDDIGNSVYYSVHALQFYQIMKFDKKVL